MNYRVELHHKDTGDQGTVIVKEVQYRSIEENDETTYWVRLIGTDPTCYPDFVREQDRVGETRFWASKDLSLFLALDDPLDVRNVSPVDEPLPHTDVRPGVDDAKLADLESEGYIDVDFDTGEISFIETEGSDDE